MKRRAVIKTMAVAIPSFAYLDLNGITLFSSFQTDFYQALVIANAKEVEKLFSKFSKTVEVLERQLGYDYANLACAYCEPSSKHYQTASLIPLMERIMDFLIKVQTADGTLNLGNVESPPDTAFILEPICAATAVLERNKATELDKVKSLAKTFIIKAGDALVEGGVHTPNHRWVVSSALARVNHLYPHKKYVNRIKDWLSEGVFIDSDGHYLERSMIYSEHIDKALITLARLLKRQKLLEPVRKNLERVFYHLEPNGELATVDSRRQDQYRSWSILTYYVLYRYMAIFDKNQTFAAIAQFIEGLEGFDQSILSQSLFYFMEDLSLQQEMPVSAPLNTHYEQFFAADSLVRFRQNDQTATIFGGTDKPLIIASGRSSNPNFFSFRKGEAVLKHVRLSTNFFSTGYFRSDGVKKEGNKYVLKQKIDVPYYQPLPKNKRRKDGDYPLSESIDHRFWNKMDFENRPVSNVKSIETIIRIQAVQNGFELEFETIGIEGVDVTIELCFKDGGQLSEMKTFENQAQNYFLQSGTGTYTFGKDTINFGPGIYAHNRLRNLDGEVYTTHNGTLRQSGLNVYLTGKTPFKQILIIS